MIPFSIQQAVHACGGVFFGDAALLESPLLSVSIDTRSLTPGALYVPVKGDVFDGHLFIPAAFEKGAVCTLSEASVPYPHILVRDSVTAFQQLAKAYRQGFDIPMVGITGSMGKTTTKELVASVLASHYTVHATKGNLNNQTGVPQVLFGLDSNHECAVLEMGTNHFGEIDRLSNMVEPTVCLFTNIGEAHIEFFGSRAGIFQGKTEMLSHRRPQAAVIANGDDDLLSTIPNALLYGLGAHCPIRAEDIQEEGLLGSRFTLVLQGERYSAYISQPGRHMVYNALAAAAVGFVLGVPVTKIIKALSLFVPPQGRMRVEKAGSYTLINDVYNANPSAMVASLKVLSKAPGRRVALLGDMYELGQSTHQAHKDVLLTAKELGIEAVIGVGQHMCAAAAELGLPAYESQQLLLSALPSLLQPGDTVLVKGSHGMHLEQTAACIQALS